MTHRFLWLDFETTNIDPLNGLILEWAAVLANDDRGGDMQPVEQYTGVVGASLVRSEGKPDMAMTTVGDRLVPVDPYVVEMHTRNGLWAECAGPEATLVREAEDFLVGLCHALTEPALPERVIVLAGSTIGFDLGWARVHMPRFAACLSHRSFDVSTLKLANSTWTGAPFVKAGAHRALPDVLESLAHAREIRASVPAWCAL